MVVLLKRKTLLWSVVLGMLTLLAAVLGQNMMLADPDWNQVDMSSLQGKRIFIDPGHGGIDSGAAHNQVIEKDITLALSLKLGQVLEGQGAQVLYSRTEDVDYYTRGKGGKRNDLLKRVAMIQEFQPDCYLSVHTNAIRLPDQQGAQVFYGGKNQDSQSLAEILQKALKSFPPGNKRQAKKDLDILLLNATDKPGVLIEAGYVTNYQEAQLLSSPEYQQRMAEQLAKGLAYHFSLKVAR